MSADKISSNKNMPVKLIVQHSDLMHDQHRLGTVGTMTEPDKT